MLASETPTFHFRILSPFDAIGPSTRLGHPGTTFGPYPSKARAPAIFAASRIMIVGLDDIARKAYLHVLAAGTDVKLHLFTLDSALCASLTSSVASPRFISTVKRR